jgi:hypothetical protein
LVKAKVIYRGAKVGKCALWGIEFWGGQDELEEGFLDDFCGISVGTENPASLAHERRALFSV